jgi:hypothetical protein
MVDTHPADPSQQIHGSTKTCLSMSGGFFVEVGLKDRKSKLNNKDCIASKVFCQLAFEHS